MSYKALLFCPDEAAARLVTQVLSELEFTVELSFEPFVTVKKLSEEHFDALVVDCNDEQNASVLFKGARNSDLNHSSLCVAVVDGQAGLAKAFKIGANLVLTKPINVEQSKNTLRVARGLLRKNAAPTQGATGSPAAATHTQAATPHHSDANLHDHSHAAAAASSPAPDTYRPSMPSTLLEAQQEKTPAAASQLVASTEPKSGSSEKSVAQSHFLGFGGSAAGHGGSAAAPALAPERPSSIHAPSAETRPATEIKSAPPLATHDSIQSTYTLKPAPLPAEVTPHPFPSIHVKSSSSKAPWIAIVVLIAAAAGYFGWRKFQPLQYLKSKTTTSSRQLGSPEQAAADAKPSPEVSAASVEPANGTASSASSTPAGVAETSGATSFSSNSAPEGFPTKENIDVGNPAEGPEAAITVVAKPEPIQVNRKPAVLAVNHTQSTPIPAPPLLVAPSANSSDSTLAGLVATNVIVPKPSGTLQISQGLTQGLLIKKVPPTYPSSALQMRKQGTVELMASISKTGAISKIRVLGGDPTLARAATEAVKQWKYRPYLLNNEPVEIETQITINFRLPN
jgi:TonB family protein